MTGCRARSARHFSAVARAPSEEPQGLVYEPELLSVDEEGGLLERLESLRFDPIVLHGRAPRRTGRHFGLDYDYESRTPKPGEPVPDWLLPVRERAAAVARHEPEELVEILVQRYPEGSTIGWHPDAPAFGTVIGVSLGGSLECSEGGSQVLCNAIWAERTNRVASVRGARTQ